MKKYTVSLILIFLWTGCFKANQWQNDLASDKIKMQNEGWNYLETSGTPNKWIMDGWVNSPTARSIGASWVINGKQQEKQYNQSNFLYSVHSYTKANGDSFVIVYQREKSKN